MDSSCANLGDHVPKMEVSLHLRNLIHGIMCKEAFTLDEANKFGIFTLTGQISLKFLH